MYLPAIQGYVPDEMVKALQAFLDFCYIVRRDVHDTESLEALQDALDRFHKHRKIFQTTGVRPPTALIYLGPMQQYTIYDTFEHLVPLMGFVHLSRNQNILSQ